VLPEIYKETSPMQARLVLYAQGPRRGSNRTRNNFTKKSWKSIELED